jgi:hypothetical protein
VTLPDATFAAAVAAAVASLASVIVNIRAARQAEARAAQRAAIGPSYEQLAKVLYQCVATSNVFLKTAPDSEARRNWGQRCDEAADSLKELRPRLRFTLSGLDEPLRTLSRVPHWAQNYHDAADGADLLKKATALRKALDGAVLRSYRRGRAPRIAELWWVRYRSWSLRKQWETEFPNEEH